MDGLHSFAIFQYANGLLQWTTGDSAGGTGGLGGMPARAGFNAGDGMTYTEMPGSRTPNMINITDTSNVGVTGLWVFQVSDAAISRPGMGICTINF